MKSKFDRPFHGIAVSAAILVGLIFSGPAGAEASYGSSTETANVQDLMYSPNAPSFGDYAVLAGLKSTNDSGRIYEMQEPNGQYYKLKNEYYLGFIHAPSGWGLTGVAETDGDSYANGAKNHYNNGNPAVILNQPMFFDNGDWNVHGHFRVFFGISPQDEAEHETEYGYYLYEFHKMAFGWALMNETVPKYYSQTSYDKGDSIYYVEDTTEISKRVLHGLRLGFGQYLQREWHRRTPTGTCDELYPFADVVIQKTAVLSPRVYMPIYASKTVSNGPSEVALNNFMFELVLKVSI